MVVVIGAGAGAGSGRHRRGFRSFAGLATTVPAAAVKFWGVHKCLSIHKKFRGEARQNIIYLQFAWLASEGRRFSQKSLLTLRRSLSRTVQRVWWMGCARAARFCCQEG